VNEDAIGSSVCHSPLGAEIQNYEPSTSVTVPAPFGPAAVSTFHPAIPAPFGNQRRRGSAL
jgi:hypothetical protein